tara:strand:- start:1030 stop:1401 length:372 start_codon:yes stop_codon:yes gene_type:complete
VRSRVKDGSIPDRCFADAQRHITKVLVHLKTPCGESVLESHALSLCVRQERPRLTLLAKLRGGCPIRLDVLKDALGATFADGALSTDTQHALFKPLDGAGTSFIGDLGCVSSSVLLVAAIPES